MLHSEAYAVVFCVDPGAHDDVDEGQRFAVQQQRLATEVEEGDRTRQLGRQPEPRPILL